jgi:hypothetical protein
MNYTEEIAYSTKDPQILTEILKRGNDDNISCYAAENPNCPKEILIEVLRRGKNDWVSWSAASNPNCTPEILVEILRRGNDDLVSFNAITSSNCPTEEKINWMIKTGRIEKEDPDKHNIEKILKKMFY